MRDRGKVRNNYFLVISSLITLPKRLTKETQKGLFLSNAKNLFHYFVCSH
jgi:hypothetical protein